MNYARAASRGITADGTANGSRNIAQAVVRNPSHPHDDNHDKPQSSQPLERSNISDIFTSLSQVTTHEDSTAEFRNPRYLGNPTLERNKSANIPEDMNCRLWITGLPPACTVSDLLGAIKDIGPVYASYVVPPPENDKKYGNTIRTSAASLTFFSETATNRFLQRHAVHRFTVGNHITTVGRHRIRAEPIPAGRKSRVLIIKGNPKIVTPQNLARLCAGPWNIQYNTDFIKYRPGKESNEIVWAFGSYRAQAQAVFWAIDKPWAGLSKEEAETVAVNFAPDPCG
ncbi:hypothetical protein F4776DRAFT_671571 [Hypoxylon sp. NC0597]|nr:hypothetical protein F4776DRAFT_671571 [Hypoxylon sp. NC0597]